jgi:hypothetical protein
VEPVKFSRPGYGLDLLLSDAVVTKMNRWPPTWWKRPRRSVDLRQIGHDIRWIRGYVSVTRLLMALDQRADQDEDGEWYE